MNLRQQVARAAAAAVALITLTASAGPAAAVQGRRLTITEFDAIYHVREDATLEVEERITVRFDGSWNGLYRWIPVIYRLDDGGRLRIYLDLQAVTDGSGEPLRHEVDREGALVKIKTWVPGARDAVRTVVYRYRVENGLRFFDEEEGMRWAHDELYWNVTGDEWEMPILRAQATVHLPAGASGLQTVAYTGARGSTAGAYESEVDGNTVRFETTERLNMGEGLTIVVGWDAGVVRRPPAVVRASWFAREYFFVLIPLIAFAFMFWLWRKKGRDPELGESIMPRYEPPEGMRPAELGTLMDFSVDPRDLSATIIDLAVRGYVRIEEVPSRIFKRPKDHIIHVLKEPDAARELSYFERETLRGLARIAAEENGGERASVKVSDLKNEFHRYVPRIQKDIYKRLSRRPRLFTTRPDRVKGVWTGIAIAVGVGCLALAIQATEHGYGQPIARWASLLATPLIVLGFGVIMPARTLRGTRLLHHVLGLREYVDRVDRHRLKYATLDHFENLLPFAAAMGLEEKWTEAFEGLLSEPPGWYVSSDPGHFHVHGFSRSLGRMSSSTGKALTTAPRSSSSGSGFSGGAGGGGGGGGGGGF